jgi:tRNA-splicing ligase RtcB
MRVIYDKEKQRVPIKTWCENPEQSALNQALLLSNHPAVVHWVSLMPDTHMGMGMPIGGVVCLENAISPNMVGSDVGCGMCALPTGLDISEFLPKMQDIRKKIEHDIPTGFRHRDSSNHTTNSEEYIEKLHQKHDGKLFWKRVRFNINQDARSQISTLGGGNHFVEIQSDPNKKVWIMIHSGSRNIGKITGDDYHKLAVVKNESWRSRLPHKDLSFFPFDSDEGQEYYEAMNFALDFAFYNRLCMMETIEEAFKGVGFKITGKMINIHHNYATKESHYKSHCIVHRKGATFAGPNTTGIIPGSMGTSSYIVKGRGNPESFHYSSHGGRRMSRKSAKSSISLHDFEKAMNGIDFNVTKNALDEAPQAYKDIDTVMEEQKDLVNILFKLTPLMVIKGVEED